MFGKSTRSSVEPRREGNQKQQKLYNTDTETSEARIPQIERDILLLNDQQQQWQP